MKMQLVFVLLCLTFTGCGTIDPDNNPNNIATSSSVPIPKHDKEQVAKGGDVEIAKKYNTNMTEQYSERIKFLEGQIQSLEKDRNRKDLELESLLSRKIQCDKDIQELQQLSLKRTKMVVMLEEDRQRLALQKQLLSDQISSLEENQNRLKKIAQALTEEKQELQKRLNFYKKQLYELSKKYSKTYDIVHSNLTNEQKIIEIDKLHTFKDKFWAKEKEVEGNIATVCYSNVTNLIRRNIFINSDRNVEILEVREAEFYTDNPDELTWKKLIHVKHHNNNQDTFDLLPFRAIIIKYRFQGEKNNKVKFEVTGPNLQKSTFVNFL